VVLLFSHEFQTASGLLLGDLIISGSACLLGVRTIYLNRAVQRIDPVKLLLAQVAFSIPCFLLWSLLFEAGDPYRWTWGLALSIGYQGVIVAGFNFILNLHLLRTYKPSGLAAYFLTSPLFGVLMSWLIVGETIALRVPISAGLVVGGVALASRRPAPRPAAVPAEGAAGPPDSRRI
jgi:drug/metabolite transporter (DMT)-like permease